MYGTDMVWHLYMLNFAHIVYNYCMCYNKMDNPFHFHRDRTFLLILMHLKVKHISVHQSL